MLKSLFSGVSGLQSHQVAMDVESNNIANVNTTGFKYSRANFSDLLAQTRAIATAPQGQLGGKNPVQVGLGSTVSSTTRIFSQGSIQNSDKNTDVAIQGDGFFIISPDGGNTYKYTRAGDFKFDAGGNFVDNNGFITQGWLRDSVTGKVDSTSPIQNIKIAPGLTTPAQSTQEVVLKANLNSGPLVKSFSPAYQISATGVSTDANGNSVPSGDMGVMFNSNGEAFSLKTGQGVWVSFQNTTLAGSVNVPASTGANDELDITFTLDDGTTKQIITSGSTGTESATVNANRYISAINAQSATTGVSATLNLNSGSPRIDLRNTNGSATASHNINFTTGAGDNSGLVASNITTSYKYQYDPVAVSTGSGSTKTFTTMADLRQALSNEIVNISANATITVSDKGKIVVNNEAAGGAALAITMSSITGGGIVENIRFSGSLKALESTLPNSTGALAFTQDFNAATHSSSIDIFDSLGTKHTLRTAFRKTSQSNWDMTISVPDPSTISATAPKNQLRGNVKFNNDGSVSQYNPGSISFSGNNGSKDNQTVRLSFGTPNKFDGMTSFDSSSSTSGISQDGFTGGDLVGIRIDQSGTLVGSFSNGRSFGLAQIGMAKFTNNEGLGTDGGNVYSQTANSGDPIIGTAATAGRGFIQSAALEASNVDLSRALTQLIIIQRGFQANGKTITTSDQLLQTLIGLKN